MGLQAHDSTLPPAFGRYRVLKLLGSGSIATVYLVQDENTAKKVVMKIAGGDLDPATRERLLNEGRALQQFQHPNIPTLYECGELPDGQFYLVSEWVDGSTLDDLRKSGVFLSISDALVVARAVAAALGHAHERGILHLDVKPSNILVPKVNGQYAFDRTKLIDFSVRGVLQPRTNSTVAGFVLGTPYYMSPEQARADALTPAADIFCLGCVMYEMLSGRRPFEGEGALEVLSSLLREDPEPLNPPVPPEVAALVRRCLEKDPGKRPASAKALESELALLLPPSPDTGSSLPSLATRILPQPLADAPSALRQAASPRTSPIALRVAAAAAVLALVAAGTWAATKLWHEPGIRSEWRFVLLGVFLVAAGIGAGIALHCYLAHRREQLAADVSALLKGAQTRRALSMTLSIQVDEVIKKCRLMDERFLGLTLAVMVKEYGSARKFDDRQKALMNAVAILDKLEPKLSPWYIRHEKLIAAGVSLVGILSGLAAAASSVAKLAAGTR